jgi:hypothetical protein
MSAYSGVPIRVRLGFLSARSRRALAAPFIGEQNIVISWLARPKMENSCFLIMNAEFRFFATFGDRSNYCTARFPSSEF